MPKIAQEEIDALRNQADIVDVISHYIPVKRAGKSYKAVCPFHNDHDPSLTITPEKKIYKCFVCGNGGNVFTFVQNYEKISFVESVERVAELSNYHLSIKPTETTQHKDPHKESLYKILNETIAFTTYQMSTSDGNVAKEYLTKRGLSEEIIKEFQIGYDPNDESLSKFLSAKGYVEKDMISTNVSKLTPSGLKDVFASRITFPIHDKNGNPIGFSARSMDPQNQSKYINTTETDVFHKGDIVYNLHRAKQEARHKGYIILCEGVTDVIAFYQAGIQNAVCTLGTACTQNQIELLKSCSAKLVFCYDGDNAGQNATYKAAKLARSLGCDVSIVHNTTGKDPDEILRAYGKEGLEKLSSQQISWMEFILNYYSNSTNLNSYEEKKELVTKVKAEIDQLDDEMERQYFIDKLNEITGLHVSYERKIVQPQYEKQGRKLIIPDGAKKAEEMILSMIMTSLKASEKFEEELGYLLNEEDQTLAMMILDSNHTKGKTDPIALMDETDDQVVKDLITKIITDDSYNQPYDEDKLNGAIRKIKIEVLQDEASQYKEQLTNALNGSSLELLMKKYNECLMEQRRLINEENREENKNN